MRQVPLLLGLLELELSLRENSQRIRTGKAAKILTDDRTFRSLHGIHLRSTQRNPSGRSRGSLERLRGARTNFFYYDCDFYAHGYGP